MQANCTGNSIHVVFVYFCSIKQCKTAGVSYNSRWIISANFSDSLSLYPLWHNRVISVVIAAFNAFYILESCDIFHQFAGNRHFTFGGFAKRYADCVANSFSQECTYTHCRLYATVFPIACLCHAQMEREVHVFQIHCCYKPTHRLHHYHSV